MNKLQEALAQLTEDRKKKQPSLMTHVVLGYPSLKESIALVAAMSEGGAAFIELQIPFSDPMADGPTIMRANEAALEQGVTPTHCLEALAKLSRNISTPLLIMSYFNLLFAYGQASRAAGKQNGASRKHTEHGGVAEFCRDAASAGALGLIVPDVPLEENNEGYWNRSLEHGLLPIPLVSPLTAEPRMKKIASYVREGFVYCVATTGTTGARSSLPEGLSSYLKTVKKHFRQPRAVGFGISTPEHVRSLAGHAQIAIVGSAMIDLIDKTPKAKRLTAVRAFTRKLSGNA